MATEEVIAWFERRKAAIVMPGARAMYDKALSALRAQQERENPQPLKLEELREMEGEPVYIVSTGRGQGWCIVYWHGAKSGGWMYFSATGTAEGMSAKAVSAKDYGDTWIAYRSKPETEVMEQ